MQADLTRCDRNRALRLKSKERKAAKLASLPAWERHVPHRFDVGRLIFLKEHLALEPAVDCGSSSQPPPRQLSDPGAPWRNLPVAIRCIEEDVPPHPGASRTYLIVESVLPDAKVWRVHSSQALSFISLVEPRWNRLEELCGGGRAGAEEELADMRRGIAHAVVRQVEAAASGQSAEARLKQMFPARWRAHAAARKLQAPGRPRGLPSPLAELSEEIARLACRSSSDARGGAPCPPPHARVPSTRAVPSVSTSAAGASTSVPSSAATGPSTSASASGEAAPLESAVGGSKRPRVASPQGP